MVEGPHDDPAIRELVAMSDKKLAKAREDGYEPCIVFFPEQDGINRCCRTCGLERHLMQLVFFGTVTGDAYAYCLALTCADCAASDEKKEAFLDRMRRRYREMLEEE